jgi:hypothetical protein
MGGIDSSDMMLYTYLNERRTVHYWKKVAFNIIARKGLNNYIVYKENYKWAWQTEIQVQQHCVHNQQPGGGVVGAEADDPQGPRGPKKLSEKQESQCIVCSIKERRQTVRTV